ncbi:hypothetical protein [Actinocrispum wychmicini]|uniref:Uncharacterized protein n=1 Tax=Actinocrispum wychmicini TaxID=1213861 RepID=A0A4R2IT87_9PSEU|nr:hypothetical protein [Actinocrispum wychmicini]TCO47338.1 hypothetical protein EV192_11778 [Actinocrispum wychmicini]
MRREDDETVVAVLATAGQLLANLDENQARIGNDLMRFFADVHERSKDMERPLVSDVYAVFPQYPHDDLHQVLTNLMFLGLIDTERVGAPTGLRLNADDPSGYRCWIKCDAWNPCPPW